MYSSSIKNIVFVFFAILFYLITPPLAAQSSTVKQLNGTSFTISSVNASFAQDHFMIKVRENDNNQTLCGNEDAKNYDPSILVVPRSLPQFNEMVSLATAAMLAGKTIRVSQVYVARCHPTWNRSQIDNLEVVN